MEKGRGFSDWIRFEDLSLRLLLEGVEDCCRDEGLERWSKGWVEGGKRFKLERRLNEAWRFLLCFVLAEEENRFSLVFPEGRGFHGGWSILAEKLRYLGVASSAEARRVSGSLLRQGAPVGRQQPVGLLLML